MTEHLALISIPIYLSYKRNNCITLAENCTIVYNTQISMINI